MARKKNSHLENDVLPWSGEPSYRIKKGSHWDDLTAEEKLVMFTATREIAQDWMFHFGELRRALDALWEALSDEVKAGLSKETVDGLKSVMDRETCHTETAQNRQCLNFAF